jgi:hypothetical protein
VEEILIMEKSAKMTKILLAALCIIIIITISTLISIMHSKNDTKFEYVDNGYATGSTLNINGEIYEEINEETFSNILTKIEKQGINPYSNEAICNIDYKKANGHWEYAVYGNLDMKNRILLKGEEDIAFNDVNYPDIYFCRQDILNLYRDTVGK